MSPDIPDSTYQLAKQAAENFISSINNVIQKNNEWWNEAKKWLENKYGEAIEEAIDAANRVIHNDDKKAVSNFRTYLNGVVNVTKNAESNIRMVRIIDIARNNNDEIRTIAISALDDIHANNGENENAASQNLSSSYAYNSAKQQAKPFVYNITITKKVAALLIKVLNELTQKYHTWYAVIENKTEEQFGRNITRLVQTCNEILDVQEGTPYALITTLMSNLTATRVSISTLAATVKEPADKNILAGFANAILWASDILNNLDSVDEHAEIKYPANTVEEEHKTANAEAQPASYKNIDIKTLKGRLMGDQSADNDLLGFSVYATAIAELIRLNAKELEPGEDNKTQENNAAQKAGKPFNIGIIAPWGHGKTTLMKNVQYELDKDYNRNEEIENKLKSNDNSTSYKATTYEQLKNYLNGVNLKNTEQINSGFPSVWFNAWRYQSSEQIWAGLGHAIITQLSSRLSPVEQEKFWFKLQLSRVDILKMRKEFYADLIKKLLPWLIAAGIAFIAAIVFFVSKISWPAPFIAIIGAVAPAIGYFKSVKDKVDGKVSVYFDEPDYSEKLGVYHHIIEDLHKVFSLVLSEDQRAVIFIDDLDRCSPNIIAEVFEAVNLMMIDPVIGKYCYFIFGMDAQVIAAALDNKYTLMSGKLKEQEEVFGSVGWYFLDKFIQLPFNVPIMSGEERLNFLKFYFEPGKAADAQKAGTKGDAGKEESIAKIQTAMKEPDAEKKQQKLTEVFKSIDDKNIEDKKEAVKEAVKEKLKEDDSEQIIDQLKFISPFLSSSPREIIRYINLLRFFNSTLFIRQSMIPGSVQTDFKGVAKYLLIALKWPQLVRWIQWEGDDELVLYNTTKDKARFLDELVINFIKDYNGEFKKYLGVKNATPPDEAAIQQSTEDLYNIWNDHCNKKLKNDKTITSVKKLAWLYDRQIMEVLLHDETSDSSFEKALTSKMW